MRVLSWNLQFFNDTRLVTGWMLPGETAAEFADRQQRTQAVRDVIEDTVTAVDPDVILIQEARCAQGATMQLATGGGPQGLIALTQLLRHNVSPHWCLVPPLRLNPMDVLALATYTETAGVLYRSDRLTFTGPYVWPQIGGGNVAPSATGPPIAPGTGPAAANYPAPWANLLPPGTNAAACCRFYNGANEVQFTTQFHRRPYCVEFAEIGSARTFRIFCVHFAPNATALQAFAELVALPGGWSVPGANQTVLLAGDFNIDLRNITVATNAYLQNAFTHGFGLLTPYPVMEGVALRRPPSTIRQNNVATPATYAKNELWDHAWGRWGAGALPGGPGTFPGQIGDLVTGTVNIAPVIGHAPIFNIPSTMTDTLAAISAQVNPARDAMFRARENFGAISPPVTGTSDHFPLVVQC